MRRDVPTMAGRPRSNSTVNHELAILKQLFAKAIAWGYLEKGNNPTENVKKLSESKGRILFLSLEEAKPLLAAASPHLRPIIGGIRHTPAGGKLRRPLNQPIGKIGLPFQDVDSAFRIACTAAGITDFHFHDLRHTAASYMVMAGVPMKTVGEILGHKTATMTERYSHMTPDHKRQAVELLPDWEENDGHKSVTNEA